MSYLMQYHTSNEWWCLSSLCAIMKFWGKLSIYALLFSKHCQSTLLLKIITLVFLKNLKLQLRRNLNVIDMKPIDRFLKSRKLLRSWRGLIFEECISEACYSLKYMLPPMNELNVNVGICELNQFKNFKPLA